MLIRLRVLCRAFALGSWTLACYLLLLVALPFQRLAPRWQLRWRNSVFRTWARGFARIVGMSVEVTGEAPEGPFFLVSNHVSYMDVVLIATRVHASFVAKADLRAWPVLGAAFAAADTIFIDRNLRRDVVRVMDRIGRELDRDLGVVLFAEGTSSKGEGILPFKPSLLEFAARRNHPVHYASIHYRLPEGPGPARELICWWGDAAFLPHLLRLLRLPRFEAELVFGPAPVDGRDRKALATATRAAIAEIFTPID